MYTVVQSLPPWSDRTDLGVVVVLVLLLTSYVISVS